MLSLSLLKESMRCAKLSCERVNKVNSDKC
jgi:hypothetical protein